MNFRKILLLSAFAGIVLGASAQTTRTFYVAKPGTLVELMTEDEANQIEHLTLQGKLNAIDFRHLRDEFKQLQTLDISNVSISMYAGKGGTYGDRFFIYQGNNIPAFAFCKQQNDSTFEGKTTLRRVILSDKTKAIEESAFKGCTNLQICQVRRKKAPDLHPASLADSISAVFVPLGCSDAYRTEKGWEGFAVIEGEPTSATVQIGRMSSLASELIRLGLHPKEVNYLTIEGKTDEADYVLIRDYMPNLVAVDLSKSNSTVIPDYTFTQKKFLLQVTLPQGLKQIGQRAFSGCIRLQGPVMLPAGVTAIEYGAFMGCERLRQVVATGNAITTLGDNLFGESPAKLVYRH